MRPAVIEKPVEPDDRRWLDWCAMLRRHERAIDTAIADQAIADYIAIDTLRGRIALQLGAIADDLQRRRAPWYALQPGQAVQAYRLLTGNAAHVFGQVVK